MATGEQIKSLIRAHFARDDEKFKTVLLQIAAYEARLGHTKLARDIKAALDRNSQKDKIVRLQQENEALVMVASHFKLTDLIVSDTNQARIMRILKEYTNRAKLNSFGLQNRRKILLEGAPGTGKTMTASVIATELGLPLFVVQMDKLVTKFMGETSVKLRQVFDSIENIIGVYLFDEFDAIGADRALDNEVGEMRRVLNSFLQFIEQDTSDNIIIAATNNHKILDPALFRRFDDVIHFALPSGKEIIRLFRQKLSDYHDSINWSSNLVKEAAGLSQAELSQICDDALKITILDNIHLDEKLLLSLIKDKHSSYVSREA